MGECFVHYGSSLFKKFGSVKLSDDIVLDSSGAQVFNSLALNGKSSSISEVFLGWSYAVFVAEGKLYYCGFKNNSAGVCSVLNGEIRGAISKVTCGWKEIFIVTEWGSCYLSETNSLNLTKVDVAGVKVRDVAVGDEQSVLLTDCGTLFAVKHTVASVMLTPVKVCTSVIEVACGKDYVLLLSADGRVFTYGNGSRGQLGHGDTDPREAPTLVEALDGIKIKSVAAGGWHAAVVSDIGDLYTWGWNESGQLGLPCAADSNAKSENAVALQCVPGLVDFSTEITVASVSCGSRHTAILTENGVVWTWGWNAYGQLGSNRDVCSHTPMPLELSSSFSVSKIMCSYWSTLIMGKCSVPQ